VLTFAQGDHVGAHGSNAAAHRTATPSVPGHWIYAPPPVIARGNLGARPLLSYVPGSAAVASATLNFGK